jgi:hypothetical protein
LSEAPLLYPRSVVVPGLKRVAARWLRLSRCQLAVALHSGSPVAMSAPQSEQLAVTRVAAELASPPFLLL